MIFDDLPRLALRLMFTRCSCHVMFTYGYGYVLRRCDPCYIFASACMIFFWISQLVSSSFVCVAFFHALTVSIEEMSQDGWRKGYTPCFCFMFVILAIHASFAPLFSTTSFSSASPNSPICIALPS